MTLILGHRGLTVRHTQNSLGALRDALDWCDGFETDVVSSRDGVAFLIHESSYASPEAGVCYDAGWHLDGESRATLGPRRLIEMDAAEIDQLRLSDGSAVPRLADILALGGRQKTANLELKGPGSAEAAFRAVAASGWAGSLCVSSSGLGLLAAYRRLDARMPLALIVEPPEFPVAAMFPGGENNYLPLVASTLSRSELSAFRIDCVVTASHTIDVLANLVGGGLWRGSWMTWTSADAGQDGALADALLKKADQVGLLGSLHAVIVDRLRS